MSFLYISMHITFLLIKIWSVHNICRLSSKHLWFMTLNFKNQFQKILPILFLAWWDHKSFSTKILDLFPDLTSWFLLPLGSGVILMGSQWTVRSASSVQFASRERALSNFQSICILWNVYFKGKDKYFSNLKKTLGIVKGNFFPACEHFSTSRRSQVYHECIFSKLHSL